MARIRNDEQYELRRARILTEAAKLFRTKGYYSASMDDLASALNVTKAAIYYYYPKKEDILLEICEQAIDRALERLRQNLAADKPASERLGHIIFDHLEIMTENLEEWTVFFQELGTRHDPKSRRIEKRRREFGEIVEAVVQDGIDSGEFRDADAHLVTMAILGMCNWTYRWFRTAARSSSEVAYEFERFMVAGLLADKAVHATPK